MPRDEPELPWYQIWLVYISYILLVAYSYVEEYWGIFFGRSSLTKGKDYAPLFSDWESFWTRRVYARIQDCWNRPVASYAGARIDVNERIQDKDGNWIETGSKRDCLNMGSYNYLGFSAIEGPCLEAVLESFDKYGISTTSQRCDVGTTDLHRALEKKTAEFLKKEDCIIFGMGYSTNACTLPCLVGKGCLIISDSLNHASLVTGCRSSGSKIKVFEHNDVDELEKIVRKSIVEGQPRTHRPWKKILIIVEGIYSMEDEAHSIGALGTTGRGVCEYAGVDTLDIDVLMGTFTKSFASVGGYITGEKALIDHIRSTSYATMYSTSMSPGCCQQALSTLGIIMGDDGTDEGKQKIRALRDNSNYFRRGLIDRGFQIYGDNDSPVIPLMIYFPSKIAEFSRECLRRNIATVVVGFPATPLLMGRARFCISAGHSKEDLKWALDEISEVGDRLLLKYGNEMMEKKVKFKRE